ncbi:MAG TPA: cell division protein FtsK [Corynebacterium urealyticum]|nr:cell division protein FtsK [Corynebacterium urealyticum]
MKAQSPPTLPKEKQPFVRILMPAIMLVAVLGMVAAMVMSGAGRSPMTFIFPLMMLGSMAMMFQSGTDVNEVRRGFHRHLDALSDSVKKARREQLIRMNREHPHPGTLWNHIHAGELPSAAPGVVRIGVAVQAPDDPLEIPVNAPPEDLEPVSAMSLRDLALRTATIEAPVAVDVRAFPYVAIVGDGAAGLARAMQAQLVAQPPEDVGVRGPHDQWLPHDGAVRVNFCTGADPVTLNSVVVEPSSEWVDAAQSQGLYLHVAGAEEGFAMSAWTVDGWAPFGLADQLSDVELAMVCRARSQVTSGTSLLELPGGDLRAPIGFSGAPVYLDIKESALGGIGPHGLCIGATGSGKSELLKSVVVSFAHNHSPEELNFILVDFKGGAAFLGLDKLPHTSAVITNLVDEAGLVDRMQDSLLGEMHRRQERLRAAGMPTALEFNEAFPGQMPALFIIVDEFSELLQNRPEFAEVFAAIGRLGRSLRMHLLLASQRFEEGRLRGLESHLSYRIALRTFSAVESRALIGSTAAFELPANPGAAILSAHDTVRFHSAYVSGPELPRDQRLIQELGSEVESTTTTLQLVVDRLQGPNKNPIWLPPLPTMLPAHEVLADAGAGTPEGRAGNTGTGTAAGTAAASSSVKVEPLTAAIGLEDLPFEGVQRTYRMDLNRRHWAIVGQPRTGKTMAVRALVLALGLSSPGVPIYIFDPGGSLRDLARLPQVAAVVGPEHAGRLLDEVDLVEGPRVLIVDGLDQLTAIGEEEQRLIQLATSGLERGLHVVVTALRWNFRPSLRDVLTGHVEMKMTALDAEFRDAQKSLPDVPGRGVSHNGKHIQVAFCAAQDVEHVRKVSVARGEQDVAMRVLPDRIGLAELLDGVPGYGSAPGVDAGASGAGTGTATAGRHAAVDSTGLDSTGEVAAGTAAMGAQAPVVPFALGGPRLDAVAWDSGEFPHLVVIGQAGAGATSALRTVAASIDQLPEGRAEVLATDTRRGLLGSPGYLGAEQFRQRLAEWIDVLHSRVPKDVSVEQLRDRSWWSGPELVLIVDDSDNDPGLDALVPLLPYAADIGLHLVLARRSGQFARSAFQPLMQAMRDHSAWLLLSAPREDGPIAGQKLCRRQPGRGVYVHAESWLVQVAEAEGSASAKPVGAHEHTGTGATGASEKEEER